MSRIFSLLLASLLLTHAERQGGGRTYSMVEVERFPLVTYGKQVMSIKAYLRKSFQWKRGMDEGDRIVFSYSVDRKGGISNLHIIEHPRYCSLCEQELLRLMKAIPHVMPAKKASKNVAVQMTTIYHFEVADLGKWE